MQSKLKHLSFMTFVIALCWCGTFSLSVSGQKLPLVFQKDSIAGWRISVLGASPARPYIAITVLAGMLPSWQNRLPF